MAMHTYPSAETRRDSRSRLDRVRAWARGDQRTPEWEPRGPLEPPDPSRLGVCCSGGGIRSAAFNLGALQVLHEQGELQQTTYLSSVSGGAYIAGARAIVETETEDHDLFRNVPPYGRGSPEEAWLRDHSNYVAPGLSGRLRLVLRLLAGMATNVLVIGLFLYAVARPAGWVYERLLLRDLPWQGPNPFRTLRPWMLLAVAVPGGLGIVLAWVDVVFRSRHDRIRRVLVTYASRLVRLAAIALVLLVAIPYLVLLLRHGYDELPSAVQALLRGRPERTAGEVTSTAGMPTIVWPMLGTLALGALRALWAKKRSFVALAVAWVIGPLTLAFVFIWLLSGGATWTRPESLATWAGVTALFLVFYFFSDLTNWSGHPFYKRLLGEAYAVRRLSEDRVEEVPYDHLLKMSAAQPAHWPQLLVCAAANISSEGITPPGRNATSFVFSSSQIGGPIVGAVPTVDFEKVLGPRARDMTVLSAVAMSSAAVSPSMGKFTKRPLRFLLAITGVRLGVWVPNPQWFERWRSKGGLRVIDRPRVFYLAKELFGLGSVHDPFLYVTDGGHFENLGLVELLRRGCTQIYCFHASGERDFSFGTLGEAIAIARADLQLDIDIDPSGMTPKEGGEARGPAQLCRSDHAVGTVRYAGGTEGVLVYAKVSVTADSPFETQAYWRKNREFPHDPTFDQLYDDEKFEAYWSLGRFTGRRVVDAMRGARERGVPAPRTPSEVPPGTQPRCRDGVAGAGRTAAVAEVGPSVTMAGRTRDG